MTANFVVYSREQLEELFDGQLALLSSRGIDPDLLGRLRKCREAVIGEAISTAYPEGHLPFAPSIGPSGTVEYVHDLAPAPAGLLPAVIGTAGLAKRAVSVTSFRTAPSLPPFELITDLLRRSALAAYGRCAAGDPPAPTISVYA